MRRNSTPPVSSSTLNLSFLNILFWMFLVVLLGPAWANDKIENLTIKIDEGNLAHIEANLEIPSSQETIYNLLTNYQNWPQLFPNHPRINDIQREKGSVIVDMSLPVSFLPMDLQLITSTRETKPLKIHTHLLQGDFEEYNWVWNLTSLKEGTHTLATLTMTVQPNIWIPEWVFRWFLQSNLEQHFENLRSQSRPPKSNLQ